MGFGRVLQLLTAGAGDDVAAILGGGGHQGQLGDEIYFDLGGDDLGYGRLGAAYAMAAGAASQLGDTLDQRDHLGAGRGHQVGQLVDDDIEVAAVILFDAAALHVGVSGHHNVNGRMECLEGRRDVVGVAVQVGEVAVVDQLHALQIDENKPVVCGGAVEDGVEYAVEGG